MPRKLIEFHPEDLRALTELAEDRGSTVQELIDEAVRDVLNKHGRPTDLKSALRESVDRGEPGKPRKR
jgi:predicted DNA-binding ribbon-helix-helix protein